MTKSIEQLDALIAERDSLYAQVEQLGVALKLIASLWPEPGMCAQLVPAWVGPNDGRLRADLLFEALNTARAALGMPTYPQPEHWEK